MSGPYNFHGRIEIYNKSKGNFPNQTEWNAAKIDNEVIEQMLSEPGLFCIQISEYLPLEVIKLLNDRFFSVRKDVTFRIYGFYGEVCDLDFLAYMPDLAKLEISVSEVRNPDVLSELSKLKSLFLNISRQKEYAVIRSMNKDIQKLAISAGGNAGSFDMDCEWLIPFKQLSELYLGKVKKNLSTICEIKSLRKLTLQGITCTSLEFLKDIPLERLAVHWGKMNCFDSLENHETIEDVELWRISKLDNVDFLGLLPNLKKIHLWQLACVKGLPEFPTESKLECIDIDECRQFENIKAVKDLKNLRKIRLIAAVPESEIAYALENPVVEEILYYCGGKKQRERVNQMINQSNKMCKNAWKY